MSQDTTPLTPKDARIALEKIRIREEEFRKQIENEIKDIKSRCIHEWVYEPDPSGNNDSGYSCSGCGAWSRRLPRIT